jgi:hypothetical protein
VHTLTYAHTCFLQLAPGGHRVCSSCCRVGLARLLQQQVRHPCQQRRGRHGQLLLSRLQVHFDWHVQADAQLLRVAVVIVDLCACVRACVCVLGGGVEASVCC